MYVHATTYPTLYYHICEELALAQLRLEEAIGDRYIYIYIYIYVCMYVYIYIYMYVHTQ